MLIKLFKSIFSILLALWIVRNTGNVMAISSQDFQFRVFDAYFASIPPQIESVFEASVPNAYFNNFASKSIAPTIDNDTGRMIGVSLNIHNTHFFHGPDIEVLCSDLLMEQFMRDNGVADVTSIKPFSFSDFVNGFIARIETKSGIYFVTFISGYDEYNGFSNQKVFTIEEFREFCMPSDAKLIVNDLEIPCTHPPYIEFGSATVPLVTTLEALGFDVRWDEEIKTAVFAKDGDVYEYYLDINSPRGDTIYKNGEMWRDVMPIPGNAVGPGIVNGVVMVPSDFPIPDVYDICDVVSHAVIIKTIDPDAPPPPRPVFLG
jgi:hypothetical protein